MIFVLSACFNNKPCTALGTSIKDGDGMKISALACHGVPAYHFNFQSF